MLLNHLRSQSDLILTTGKTIRAERYQRSKWAPIAVLTRSIATLEHPLFTDASEKPDPLLLVESVSTPNDSTFEIWKLEQNWTVESLLQKIDLRGFSRVLLETGPAATKIFEPYLTEICMTYELGADVEKLIQIISQREFTLASNFTIEHEGFARFIAK